MVILVLGGTARASVPFGPVSAHFFCTDAEVVCPTVCHLVIDRPKGKENAVPILDTASVKQGR